MKLHYFTLFTFFVYYAHGLALPPLLCRQEKSYTWPGSNWRPSACEADVIATRPQVLLPLVALALGPGETNMLGSSPCFRSTSPSSPRRQDLTQATVCEQAASCGLIHLLICHQLCTINAKTRRPVSRACGVVIRFACGRPWVQSPAGPIVQITPAFQRPTSRGAAQVAGTHPLPVAFAV